MGSRLTRATPRKDTARRSGNSAVPLSTGAASCAGKAPGRAGEELAAGFLESSGYRILARNYRTRWAEIDIIALDRGTICFIEVRSRSGISFGTPEESISRRKRAKISHAALCYLQENGALERKARFDVVCVSGRMGENNSGIRLIKDAFELEGDA